MIRILALLALVVPHRAAAQGATVAFHPLELRELTFAQRERLQAQFDVMLARTANVHLASSVAIDEAVHKTAGRDCEVRDQCLRFLAEATESLYAIHARLRPDPLGLQLMATARVVRSDGALIRTVSLVQPLGEEGERTEKARELLSRLLEELALGSLSATLAVPSAPGLAVEPPAPAGSARRPTGIAVLGLGLGTLAGGAALAGVAVSGRSKLSVDDSGAVPPGDALRALEVAREAQVATVLIPIGALTAVIGGLLAFWPEQPPVVISLFGRADGAGVRLEGRLP